jgi:hypothetical protein
LFTILVASVALLEASDAAAAEDDDDDDDDDDDGGGRVCSHIKHFSLLAEFNIVQLAHVQLSF